MKNQNEIYIGPVVAAFAEALKIPHRVQYNHTAHPADEPKSQFVDPEEHPQLMALWEGPAGRAFSRVAMLCGYESDEAANAARIEYAKTSPVPA